MFYFGLILIISLMIALAILLTKFSKGNAPNSFLVSGALIGTLVGGSSTIGTAQLAYNFGFSAWWFTLGGGIGVLLLLIFYFGMRKNNSKTIAEFISLKYGKTNGIILSILNSIGTFLSFIAQIISGAALISAVITINYTLSILIVCLLIFLYAIFGGQKILARLGLIKTILLFLSMTLCSVSALVISGGFSSIFNSSIFDKNIYFNLFARGFLKDGGSGLSLIIGVVTTQSYISAVLSAKSDKDVVKGSIITSIIVPLIGVMGIIVGLYMKANYPSIDSRFALPSYIMKCFPNFVSGLIIGILLVAVVGTGAGLAYGISQLLVNNIFHKANKTKLLKNIIFLLVVLLGFLICVANLDDLVLGWSFLSMGLRGAVCFCPFIAALFIKKRISNIFITVSMIAGAALTIVGRIVLPENIDPMFLGLIASFIILVIGCIFSKEKRKGFKNENQCY